MKKSFLAPLFLLAAIACTNDDDDDDDDVKIQTNRTDPKVECTARCSEERTECAKACINDDNCVTACTDKARDCEVDCE
jgi:hypothetical protein